MFFNRPPTLPSILGFGLALYLGTAVSAQAQENDVVREQRDTVIRLEMTPSSPPANIASVSYGHLDRSGKGRHVNGNSVNLGLVQRLSGTSAQFWGLGLAGTNSHAGTQKSDGTFYSLSYGQLWASPSLPGLSYSLSGYASYGNGDFEKIGSANSSNKNGAVGLVGGVTQAIPLSPRDMVQAGASLATSYAVVEGSNDKSIQLTVYPFVQYSRRLTPSLSAYGRVTGSYSSQDTSMSGNRFLFTPKAGLSYKFGDFTAGANYTYETVDDHRGRRVGLSLSRAF